MAISLYSTLALTGRPRTVPGLYDPAPTVRSLVALYPGRWGAAGASRAPGGHRTVDVAEEGGHSSLVGDVCEFCEIVAGRAPAMVVAEWSTAVAFFPLAPATLGHTLVVPRRHVKDLWSADAELGAELIRDVLELAHDIRAALKPGGMNIINSAGRVATQTIMHLHVHVVPRYDDDNMGEIWPTSSDISTAETEDALGKIRRQLAPTRLGVKRS